MTHKEGWFPDTEKEKEKKTRQTNVCRWRALTAHVEGQIVVALREDVSLIFQV